MSRKRLFFVLAALALVVIGALTIRVAIATSAVASIGHTNYNEVERNPSKFLITDSINLSDYALRHRGEISRMVQPDLSDYALHHPGSTIHPVTEPEMSDGWLWRLEDLRHTAQPDLSDYALRHRDEIKLKTQPDLSDYALRHPELMHPASDLSDWYLRHRGEYKR